MNASTSLRLSKGVLGASTRRKVLSSSPSSPRWARAASTVSADRDPQLADYPDLPWVSNQNLPARGWWDQQMRRNFGDPIHENDEVLSMWGPDVSVVPPQRALFHFSLAVSAFVGFGFLCKYALVPERPTVPREYPFSGLVRELGGLEENKAREATDDGDD
ncbi:Ndufb8, NADH dehydrogenase 19kDa subunit [Phlebopus sp. FC_14]|nr:Ndufb8, NADH dehydrogenase 19kDa subunit [Phlebopus sp. FC_14]